MFLRLTMAIFTALALTLPASAQIQIEVKGVGEGKPKIVINGIAVDPPQVKRLPGAEQRAAVERQLEKAIKDLEAPADQVNLEQVRKDLADALAKVKNLPLLAPNPNRQGQGLRIIRPGNTPPAAPAQPVPSAQPLPPDAPE